MTTPSFHPEKDGIAEAAKHLALRLREKGHEVSIATNFNSQHGEEDLPGLEIIRFAIAHGDHVSPGIEEFQRFLRKDAWDAIILQGWYDLWPSRLAFPILPLLKAKKIIVSHGYGLNEWHHHSRFPWGLGSWLKRQPSVWKFPSHLSKLDHVVLLSHKKNWGRFLDRQWMEALKYPHFSVIPNGASLTRRAVSGEDGFRKKFCIPENDLLVLTVANYFPGKNQLGTLEAFAKTAPENATLVFIGSQMTEYAESLTAAVARLQSNRATPLKVHVLSGIPRSDIGAAYSTAQVCALSSLRETQPITLIDAMNHGVPFVSTDTGCVAEMPGGLTASSPEEFQEALRKLLTDESLRRKLGKEGLRAATEVYNWDKSAEAFEKLLLRLVPHTEGHAKAGVDGQSSL